MGRIRLQALDLCRLARVVADAHEVHFAGHLEGDHPRGMFKAVVLLEGRGTLHQDSREALLAPGDVAIYDASTPYSLTFEERVDLATLTFPHDALDISADAVRRVTAVTFRASEGLAAVVSPFMTGLGRRVDDTTGMTGSTLAHSALDLLSILLADAVGRASPQADPRAELRLRIHTTIESRLGEPDLSPAVIAAAHFISTRHLHSLFKQEGLTVSGWIRVRRLENLRRDILDPRLVDRSISEIGRRWGLVDSAHLSHAFKAQYGEAPSGLRTRLFGRV